jgi:hypothetical protein
MAVWQVNTIPWPVELVGNETGWVRAFEILRRDHLRSEKLAPLCERISYGLRKEYGEFLRAALEGNPHPDVQAAACLGLARYLGNRAARVESIGDRVREFEELYGKEYIASLRGQDPGREIEALLDRAVKEFGTRKTPSGESIAEKAGAELFERRHLAVGREAPDIEGEDHEGARFRLRDYRGKVVLLDFWSYV